MISMFKVGGLAVAFFLAFAGVSTESHAAKKLEKKKATKTGQKDDVKCESCATRSTPESSDSHSTESKDGDKKKQGEAH